MSLSTVCKYVTKQFAGETEIRTITLADLAFELSPLVWTIFHVVFGIMS